MNAPGKRGENGEVLPEDILPENIQCIEQDQVFAAFYQGRRESEQGESGRDLRRATL
jgi:hypothetical protein